MLKYIFFMVFGFSCYIYGHETVPEAKLYMGTGTIIKNSSSYNLYFESKGEVDNLNINGLKMSFYIPWYRKWFYNWNDFVCAHIDGKVYKNCIDIPKASDV